MEYIYWKLLPYIKHRNVVFPNRYPPEKFIVTAQKINE